MTYASALQLKPSEQAKTTPIVENIDAAIRNRRQHRSLHQRYDTIRTPGVRKATNRALGQRDE